MNIKNIDWQLAKLGDCSVLNAQSQEAAKEAAHIIQSVRNMLGLDADCSAKDIIEVLNEKLNGGN